MKRKVQLKTVQTIIVLLSICFSQSSAFGQTVSEWRSAASGTFANAGGTVWEKLVLGAWTLQIAAAKPSGSSNVTIRSGHTVTIDATPTTVSMLNLTIEAGGTLNSALSAPAGIGMRLGVSSATDVTAGFTNNNVTLTNNGTLGSTTATGDGINLEVGVNCASLTVTGTGTTRINRFRPLQANPNVPTTITFNHNVDFTINNNYAFSAYQNSGTNTLAENIIVNINAGKTVKIVNAGGFFHGGVSSTAPANAQGTITYNIAGTLDLSATTSSGLQTSSNATGAASLNLNIKNGGLMKLGTGFSAYKGASNGSINMTIENGGVVDGTLLTAGVTNNNSTLNTGYTWFVTQGTGVLKLPVAAVSQTFPIGPDATHYNPVTMNNGGGVVFAANVVNGNAPAGLTDATKALNRTWTVTPASTGATADLNFGYNTGDANAACVLTDPMFLGRNNGSIWEILASGTPSVPSSGATNYQVGFTAVTSFSTFTFGNAGVIPVELTTFKGTAKSTHNQLDWTTASERNNAEFAIERSQNGIDFTKIGSVKGNGTTNHVSNYTFTDFEGPLSINGINYYRLRQMDGNGRETLSNTITISSKSTTKESILNVYPTATDAILTIDYSANGAVILKVMDVLGRTVLTQSDVANNGFNSTQMDVSALSNGLYVLTFETATAKNVVKFEKK
jgi:hypothetical protein